MGLESVRPRRMTIGQMARTTKLTPRAIRYYEEAGLVQKTPRTASNYRLYGREAVEQLRFVARCRSLGFSLKEIGALCAIIGSGTQTCPRVEARVREHLDLVDTKIRELIKIKSELADSLSRCTGNDAPRCDFVELLRKQQQKD
jgi:DNA-binding transcriptional MerR regulator